jgi:hypothetical protein
MTRGTFGIFGIAVLSAHALAGGLAAQDVGVPAGPSIGVPAVGATAPVRARDARFFGHSGALRAVVVPSTGALPRSLLDAARVPDGDAVRWEALSAGGSGGLLGDPVATPASGVASSADGLLGAPIAGEGLIAPPEPGIWSLVPSNAADGDGDPIELSVITQVPFERKTGAVLNGYRIGRYPTEGVGRTDNYAPPTGFIEVTRENQDFWISEHFQLRQFLTKNQADVWPKYVALDLRLIDKLELILQELNTMGIRADRMHVMSGFRTPEYNGPGRGGRAHLSRHTYGDAADVWVDSDGNGYMDDLNGDGVVDFRDAQVMLRAVERVEQKYPELVGGAGLYVATSAHGPYIH